MEAEFRTFNDIEDIRLRVFNRMTLMMNIKEDFGAEQAQEYARQFTDGERKQMIVMSNYIKSKGADNVRKEITKGLALVE
tara:strand:- start:220 stop:459 length:240 start_codon:yes stop_codon:yes gene_type:complete